MISWILIDVSRIILWRTHSARDSVHVTPSADEEVTLDWGVWFRPVEPHGNNRSHRIRCARWSPAASARWVCRKFFFFFFFNAGTTQTVSRDTAVLRVDAAPPWRQRQDPVVALAFLWQQKTSGKEPLLVRIWTQPQDGIRHDFFPSSRRRQRPAATADGAEQNQKRFCDADGGRQVGLRLYAQQAARRLPFSSQTHHKCRDFLP